MLNSLSIKSVCSFRTYPTTIYGDTFKNLTFTGRISADHVKLFGVIPETEHRRVVNSLPDGSPDNPREYPWLTFENTSGETIVLGEPWINEATLEVVGSNSIWQVEVVGDSSLQPKIRSALNSIGIFKYTITDISSSN